MGVLIAGLVAGLHDPIVGPPICFELRRDKNIRGVLVEKVMMNDVPNLVQEAESDSV